LDSFCETAKVYIDPIPDAAIITSILAVFAGMWRLYIDLVSGGRPLPLKPLFDAGALGSEQPG
jgi:hypothetical protein